MEMKILQNLKKVCYLILILIFSLLLTVSSVNAKYFESNLSDFIKTERQITIPIFEPLNLVKLKIKGNTILTAAGSEDLTLKEGESYFISQNKMVFEAENKAKANPKAVSKEETASWGVQMMASSNLENAEELKQKAAGELDAEFLILEEDGLFKLIAGDFQQRQEAETLQQKLIDKGYNGWPREVFRNQKQNSNQKNKQQESQPQTELQQQVIANKNQEKKFEEVNKTKEKSLILYNQSGEKLREAYIFEIKGQFKTNAKNLEGEYSFGPLAKSVLFSYKTDLEELTAYLLQQNLHPGTPTAALKAQAVIYRTALLYQLEVQGARLENLDNIRFGNLSPIFKEITELTKGQVLVRKGDFYYNTDYSLKELKTPKTSLLTLAKAKYKYREILNYYYERSQVKKLNELLDSEEKFTARVAKGLYFKEIRQLSWSGPRILTLLDYNLNNNNLALKPVLAKGIVSGREDLAELIDEHSALAGVNGGYFNYTGRPLGLLYIEGELVSEPLYNRSAILINQDNQISFSRVDWNGSAVIKSINKSIKIEGINREIDKAKVLLFNHFYGYQMPPLKPNYYDLVVRNNKVLGVENNVGSQTPIPPDGFILRLSNAKAEIRKIISQLKETEIVLNYNFIPDFEKNNILHAVGGGPRLLKNGEIVINGQAEHFQDDILLGRAPRTAAALTKDNHLLLLTIDGRQSKLSVGMTLKELAQTLKKLGADDAVNLDGGGSARMVVRGFTMSNPSEKRPISNGVIVDENEKNSISWLEK